MALVITKLDNNQIEVTGGAHPYTLLPSYEVNEAAEIDGVKIVREGKMKDQFIQSNVTQVVRQDGTIVAISSMATLYSELKEYFIFEVSGSGGTTVDTAFLFSIGTGDWTPGGEAIGSTQYYIVNHNLGTQSLLQPSIWETDTGDRFIRQINAFYTTGVGITDSPNQVRIEVTAVLDVDGVVSNGGSSVVNFVIPSGVEITTDYTLVQADAGVRHSMNCATTADITVNSGSLDDGESAYFTWTGVTQPEFIEGTATIEIDTFGSAKCIAQKATFGIMRRGSVYEVIGKFE